MKKLTVKEYVMHFENTDHAEYIEKVTYGGSKYMTNSRKDILKRGKKSEKVLVKHGLVDKKGQLVIKQKCKIKKKVINWFDQTHS